MMVVISPIETAKAQWEANSLPYPLITHHRRRIITEDFRRLGDAIALLVWTDKCEVKKIESLCPRTGAASHLLRYILSLADAYEITLFGNARAYTSPHQGSCNSIMLQADLEIWYIKYGFTLHRFRVGGEEVVEFWYPHSPHAA